jgi:SOS-response transcriptional repressor LexA
MRAELQPTELRVLACIAARKLPPTIREIARVLGHLSTNRIGVRIKWLTDRGLIAHEPYLGRVLRVTEAGMADRIPELDR